MTHVVVNSGITPRISYSPTTGTSYTIPTTWGFFSSSDITVYSGTTQLSYAASPTSSTNFATSGTAVDGGFQGGNVVLGAASTANTITLILEVPVARETDFPYPAATINIEDLNTDLDKSYVLHQQFVRDLARAVLLADSDTGSVGTLPQTTARAGKFLSFDSTGGVTASSLTLSGTTVSVSAFMSTVLDDSDAATARATLSAVTGTTVSVDSELALFSGTGGITLKRASLTGVVKATAGVASAATAGTDYVSPTATALLTAGYSGTPYNIGTQSTGTLTPLASNGNLQYVTNGGAHTFAPTTTDCSIVVQYTNNASAGAITTSGFTWVTGSSITTTNGADFLFYCTVVNGFKHLHVQAMQ